MTDVAATRAKSRTEALSSARAFGGLASPQEQDTRENDKAGRVDGKYRGCADPRDEEARESGTDRTCHVHAHGGER
jgi:hypothetical protein